MKNGNIEKKPITGGSKGLPALKKEKKNVIIKNIAKIEYSLKCLM
jgi:hypothetical protein